MGNRNISNDTGQAKFVGGKLLQPGESREFSEADLPPELQEPKQEEAPAVQPLADRLALVLLGNVASVVEEIPALQDDELALLLKLENEAGQRVSVTRAIDAEVLARANAKLDEQKAQA